MEKIRCVVERVTYQNEENGWSVLRASFKVGATLMVKGEWRMDPKFGKQIKVESWTEEITSSIVGIEKYLGSATSPTPPSQEPRRFACSSGKSRL